MDPLEKKRSEIFSQEAILQIAYRMSRYGIIKKMGTLDISLIP